MDEPWFCYSLSEVLCNTSELSWYEKVGFFASISERQEKRITCRKSWNELQTFQIFQEFNFTGVSLDVVQNTVCPSISLHPERMK